MKLQKLALLSAIAVLACGLPPQQPEEEVQSLAEELRAANRSLAVSIAAVSGTIDAQSPVLVDVTVRNVSNKPVSLLQWFAPSGELEEPLFAVTRDGLPVEWTGPHYKRPAISAIDYLSIPAGGALIQRVDLTGYYDFSASGLYEVRFDVVAKDLHGLGSREAFRLQSNAVSATVGGRPNAWGRGGSTIPPVGNISFSGRCDQAQADTIVQAVGAAKSYSTESRGYLARSGSATPRYVTWFGAYSASGWSTASSHFVAIEDAFYTKPLTIDCSCKKSYYAYVYPTRPYQIFVCRAFWAAPMTGTDSKAGTLIHEMSHFDVVAATDDWVYGQAGAKNLAATEPAKALNNADNHEYFAENTPFLQ